MAESRKDSYKKQLGEKQIEKSRKQRKKEQRECAHKVQDEARVDMENSANHSDVDEDSLKDQLTIMATSIGVSTEQLIERISDIGFQTVMRKSPISRAEKVSSKPTTMETTKCPIPANNNIFQFLPIEEETRKEPEVPTKYRLKANNTAKPTRITEKQPNKQTKNVVAVIAKKERIPPIYIYNMNAVAMSNIIRENNLKGIQVRAVNSKKHRIQCSDTSTYKQILDIIKESDIDGGHTFTLPENKVDSILLKGLSHKFGGEAVKSEIYDATGLVVAVKPFKTDNANQKGWSLNLYTVSAKKEVLAEVTKITGLFYYRVSWDKITKKEMVRCARCQGSGHTIHNCLNKPGCCKCPGEHLSWECPMTRPGPGESYTTQAYCRNCKMEGHPTTYKGCPARKEKLKVWKDNRREIVPSKPATRVRPETTYADAVKVNHPTPERKVSDQGGIEFLMGECDNIFKVGFEELLTKISNFQHQYRALSSLQQKQAHYVKFMASICRV